MQRKGGPVAQRLVLRLVREVCRLCLSVLEREQTERKDSESSVSALKRQLASIKEKCNKVDIEIDQVKAAIAALRKGTRFQLILELSPQYICSRTQEGREGS